MKTTFQAVLSGEASGPTGVAVPPEALAELGAGQKPAVKVDLSGYQYRSTLGVMGGASMLPVSAAHRQAAGLRAGDPLTVTLELDQEPRTLDVPDDLSAALTAAHAQGAFDALAFSRRKEHVRQVEEARTPETREQRVAKIVSGLGKA